MADPDLAYEEHERQMRVLAAIRALPEHERMVTLLFYIGDYAQSEIAAFLEVPLTTVKKRLFSPAESYAKEWWIWYVKHYRKSAPRATSSLPRPSRCSTRRSKSFIGKVRQDRYIIAAILFGSLSHDTVWRKS